ncbi:MAG: T9SS type A sorting domain-containing protein [bacterium]
MKKVIHICQVLFLIGIISFLFSSNAKGQTYQDSCFRLIWEDNHAIEYYNPDSVMYDSCKCGMDIFEFSKEYKRWPKEYFYAKQWFWFNIPNGSLDMPQAPSDTTIIKNWTDISSSYTNLRNDFESLENTYGNFILRKLYPEDVDTLTATKVWLIKFDNYVNIDSVETFLKIFNDVDELYPPYYVADYAILITSASQPSQINDSFLIYPNPASDYIEILADSRRQTADGKKQWDIQIYNVYGECLSNLTPTSYTPLTPLERGMENGVRIDVSGFPNGIYFLRIGNEIQKFVVLR